MAKFLTTLATSSHIEDIIINANRNLTLVCPYFKISNILLERLKDAEKRGVKITIIYGKEDLTKEQRIVFKQFLNVEIFFCKNLHAKCYHNEDKMIISSMNLYEFSERNNREMGIYIEKEIDNKFFQDALNEITSIKDISNKEKKASSNYEVLIDDYTKNLSEKLSPFLIDLSKLIKNEFPNSKIELDKFLKIEIDINGKLVLIEVSTTVDLKFQNKGDFDFFKASNKDAIKTVLPNYRFYWNNYILNIYPSKKFFMEFEKPGLEKTVQYFFNLINTLLKKV